MKCLLQLNCLTVAVWLVIIVGNPVGQWSLEKGWYCHSVLTTVYDEQANYPIDIVEPSDCHDIVAQQFVANV